MDKWLAMGIDDLIREAFDQCYEKDKVITEEDILNGIKAVMESRMNSEWKAMVLSAFATGNFYIKNGRLMYWEGNWKENIEIFSKVLKALAENRPVYMPVNIWDDVEDSYITIPEYLQLA